MDGNTDQKLSPVLSIDVIALCLYYDEPVRHVSEEGGKVALWFCSDAVLKYEELLTSGKAIIRADKWSEIQRRIRTTYTSPAARSALRSRTRDSHHEAQR